MCYRLIIFPPNKNPPHAPNIKKTPFFRVSVPTTYTSSRHRMHNALEKCQLTPINPHTGTNRAWKLRHVDGHYPESQTAYSSVSIFFFRRRPTQTETHQPKPSPAATFGNSHLSSPVSRSGRMPATAKPGIARFICRAEFSLMGHALCGTENTNPDYY